MSLKKAVSQKDFIDKLKSCGFILVDELEEFTTKIGTPGWHSKTPPKHKQKGTDQGNWVYIIIVEKGSVEYIMRIGGTGAVGGMKSRINSYSSGRPNCDKKNGDVNRRVYKRIVKYLARGWEVKFMVYKCQTEKISISVPWRTEKVEGYTQTFKIYEENLIKFYEKKYGKKPAWNANTN